MAAALTFIERVPDYIDDIGYSLPKVMSRIKDIENIFAWHLDSAIFEEDKEDIKITKKYEKDTKSALKLLETLVSDLKKERKSYDMMIGIMERKI